MNGATSQRWILHADMDAFYASIEQRDHPELRGKPVIVGATSPRGVVAAASYEARRFGVRSAMPGFRARELCPQGIYLPSNIGYYAEVSHKVHAVFERFTPKIEPLALDEAFLDVTGSVNLFGGVEVLAGQLKAGVREATELIVSIGAAPNKLVAKIACRLSKPDGLLIVPQERVRLLLEPLAVRYLFGVGPVLGATLENLGIRTLGDLASYDARLLEGSVGERASELQRMAQGLDARPVEDEREAKSYGEENTFEVDVGDVLAMTGALTVHSEVVARRVRRDGLLAKTITLKIKLARARAGPRDREDGPLYPVLTRSRTLPTPTNDGAVVRRVAVELLEKARLTEPVRLLGVSLSRLVPQAREQLDLFEHARSRRLGPALDAIQARFGDGAIRRAVDPSEKATPSSRWKRGTSSALPRGSGRKGAR